MVPISIRRSVRLRNKAAASAMLSQTKPEGGSASNQRSTQQRGKLGRKRAASNVTLPDDLIIEILSRLPPKPFFRCKCVSKSWLALSSVAFHLNKYFGPSAHGLCHNTFSQQNVSSIGFVNLSAETDEVDTTFGVSLNNDNLMVVDCCNGLLLVEGWNLKMRYTSHLYVCNPATQKILAMWSLPPSELRPRLYEAFSLAFDPQVQSEFHVVCFRGWSKEGVGLNFFHTFSSKTGKWKSAKKLGHDVRIMRWFRSVFVDGKVHRLTTRREILSVDPNKGSHQLIQPPHFEPVTRCQIGQSQGLLNFLTLDNNYVLFVWTLKSFDQQEWVLKHQLSLSTIYGANMNGPQFISMNFHNVLVHYPGKPVILVAARDRKLISFDLNTGEREELCILPGKSFFNFWVYVPYYPV